jgi:hypothetical protein
VNGELLMERLRLASSIDTSVSLRQWIPPTRL